MLTNHEMLDFIIQAMIDGRRVGIGMQQEM
jgi:hypothetical protein